MKKSKKKDNDRLALSACFPGSQFYICFLFLAAAMIHSEKAVAQHSTLKDISIEIHYTGSDLLGFLKVIEETTDFAFAYSLSDVPGKSVTIRTGIWTMSDLLNEIATRREFRSGESMELSPLNPSKKIHPYRTCLKSI